LIWLISLLFRPGRALALREFPALLLLPIVVERHGGQLHYFSSLKSKSGRVLNLFQDRIS
jgi:hypothetical protein